MDIADLDYSLPEALIAEEPSAERDAARMLVLGRGVGEVTHAKVRDLSKWIPPSLLVLNDTRVFPARLHGVKETGGHVELLLLRRLSEEGPEERWLSIGKSSKPIRGAVDLGKGAIRMSVESRDASGTMTLQLTAREGTVSAAIELVGEIPLPPYIKRATRPDDRERYQTVFAKRTGAVAAPTAGLHLTQPMMAALEKAGHRFARVTLHVGPGTFAPLKTNDLDAHVMHEEQYEVTEEAALAIQRAKREGRPIVAIGTTVVRTLESIAATHGQVIPGKGETRLFIRPPYDPRVVQGMLTNFHLPRSTLLALVMAFAGVDRVRAAYEIAVREKYRFFSYGDAMLLPPMPRRI